MSERENPPTDSPFAKLSTREIEILRLKVDGISNGDIADALFVAPSTVKTYVHQIYNKLGIHSEDEINQRAQQLFEGSVVPVQEHNLPAQATPFIGRVEELEELARLFADPDIRLVTIFGPGGMGKTRLSLEAAEQQIGNFANGVYFAALASLRSPDMLMNAIAECVGFPGQASSRRVVLDYFHDRRMLLVLDNMEHLLDGVDQIAEILQVASGIKILVTSRVRLNLTGETIFNIGGLLLPPDDETPENALTYSAIQLFERTASRIQTTFALTSDHLPAVIRICRQAGGMPLGIELAAAWIDTLSPPEIAEEIERNLDFLETGYHDVPERQRSIRAVFQYAWNQLNDSEQQSFMRLSIFRGGFSRQAAEFITGTDLRILRVFVDKGLLTRDADGRYDTHELLRQYAHDQLKDAGETGKMRDAHTAYYARFIHERENDLKGHKQIAVMDEIISEYENVRKAWYWAAQRRDHDSIRQMLESLYWIGFIRLTSEPLYRQALSQLAPRDDEKPPAVWAELLARGWSCVEQPQEQVREALKIAQEHHDHRVTAICLQTLGWLTYDLEQDYRGAIAFYEQSLAYYRREHDPFAEADVLTNLGLCYARRGDVDTAVTYYRQGLAISRENGNQLRIAVSLALIGENDFIRAHYAEAEKHFEEAAAITRDMASLWSLVWNNAYVGILTLLRGDMMRAKKIADECLQLAEKFNDARTKQPARILAGLIANLEEDYEQGRKLCEPVQATESAYGFIITSVGDLGIAIAACGLKEYDTASDYLWQVLTDMPYSPAFKVLCLAPAAVALAANGAERRAVEALGLAFQHPTSATGWLENWPLLARLRDDLESKLGADAYADAWKRAATLDLDTVIAALNPEMQGEAAKSAQPPSFASDANDALIDPLSERELEVLRLVAAGLSNKQVAEQLVVDVTTVKKHITHIYDKLGVASRTQAILRAQELKLI
jgi:predicted ATPase/DNA-binding NarL/FixJ family response regulator